MRVSRRKGTVSERRCPLASLAPGVCHGWIEVLRAYLRLNGTEGLRPISP